MAQPPAFEIENDKIYRATITTNRGTLVLHLDPKLAPNTVNNFVALSRQGYYDGLTFHRVISNFMVQGGCPLGTGTGGPGYEFADELTGEETYPAGSLAMANAGPGTNGSQFFITHSAQHHLDDRHSVFGKVTSGQDVVNAIRQGDKIQRIDIEEK